MNKNATFLPIIKNKKSISLGKNLVKNYHV